MMLAARRRISGSALQETGEIWRLCEPSVSVPKAMSESDCGSFRLSEITAGAPSLPKVKKVFIRSGIRFDYLMADKDDTFFRELCKYHVSGQLKVAPEHISDKVLMKLGKPENCSTFRHFARNTNGSMRNLD